MTKLFIIVRRIGIDVWIRDVFHVATVAQSVATKEDTIYCLEDERFQPDEHYYNNRLWRMGITAEYVERNGQVWP